MNFTLKPKEIFKVNLYLILLLLCANILGIISKYYFEHDYVFGLIPLFDFNGERNVPTLYSSIALVFVFMLLTVIAFKYRKMRLNYFAWLVLSWIFLFLAIDEISSIHEGFSQPVKEQLGTSGLFFYAWVIPYGIALIIFVIAYLRFLAELPKNIMRLFLASGAIFVTGAIGFELLSGRQADLVGTDNIIYCILYTCEEFLEMFGIALFIYTLLTFIVTEFESMVIIVSKK